MPDITQGRQTLVRRILEGAGKAPASEANVKTRLSRARLQIRNARRLASMEPGTEEDRMIELALSDVDSSIQIADLRLIGKKQIVREEETRLRDAIVRN